MWAILAVILFDSEWICLFCVLAGGQRCANSQKNIFLEGSLDKVTFVTCQGRYSEPSYEFIELIRMYEYIYMNSYEFMYI